MSLRMFCLTGKEAWNIFGKRWWVHGLCYSFFHILLFCQGHIFFSPITYTGHTAYTATSVVASQSVSLCLEFGADFLRGLQLSSYMLSLPKLC